MVGWLRLELEGGKYNIRAFVCFSGKGVLNFGVSFIYNFTIILSIQIIEFNLKFKF